MTPSYYILPHNCDPVLKSSVFNSVSWHLNPMHSYNFFYFAMENIHMRFNRYIFVSLLPYRCVLFNDSCHNNFVCSVRAPYFLGKSAFIQSWITLQPLQLLKKYFGELWPRSWLFVGTHFQSSIVNFIFHHFCTTLCHLIVILPKGLIQSAISVHQYGNFHTTAHAPAEMEILYTEETQFFF